VAVEGVVQAGNESHAIIKLPQDSTSRYVSEGQQLPGGELLVKRIEFPEDSDPVVVLEQNGIEVALAVGEPAQSEQTEESTDIASSMGAPSDSDPSDSEPSDSLADDSDTDDSDTSDSDTSDSDTSEQEAVEPVKVTQPIEDYTAAIPVPSPPPLASDSTKKQREKVAVPRAPNNYKPSVEIAEVGENYPSETAYRNEDSVRGDRVSSDRAGQDQAVDSQYASSEAGSINQPELTASANALNPTDRQQLVERLRTSSSLLGNRIESNSSPNLQANVEGTYKQKLIEQLRSEKPLSTSNELLTQKDSRVLLHRQKLINQLRSTKAN
jgi:hypothetical protein